MQHLEVSCAVRPIWWPLGVKWLKGLLTDYICINICKYQTILIPKYGNLCVIPKIRDYI